MAGAQEEFVHPVIQAMENAYQLIQRTKAQKFDQELAQRQSDLQQKQFEELQNQHQLAEKHANEQHDINLQTLELARRQHQLDNTSAIQNIINSGVKPIQLDKVIPGVMSSIGGEPTGVKTHDMTIPGAVSGDAVLPGAPDVHFDPRAFSTPEENLTRQIQGQAALTGATTTAQQTALKPFADANSERDKQNRLAEIKLQGENALNVENRRRENEILLENMKGNFALQAARIAHQHGIEDQAPLVNNALNGILDGQTQYSALPKDIKESVSALAGTKGWQLPTNQISYSKNLNAISSVQELINQARDLAVNYSRDSGGQSGLAQTYSNLTGKPAPFTDLKSKLDTFKANGGTLASFYDQQNRKSDQEIIRQALGMFDPQATIQQNLAKIQAQKGPLNNLVKSTFAGMKPEQIDYILHNRGIEDLGGFSDNSHESVDQPAWLKIAPKKNSNGSVLDPTESIKRGQPVYKRSQ